MQGNVARRYAYAGLGTGLAAGAPLGLLLVEAVRAREVSWDWLVYELARQAPVYVYVSASTALVFAAFGYALGRQADVLQELARSDPLTGLLNRRAFQERMQEEFARAMRHDLPLSLLVLDLDGLKELNDRQGHRHGDAALRGLARALRIGSRATDVAGRWGGDEFVVLAPATGRAEALQLAHRIRAVVREGPASLTASIGVATLDPAHPLPGPETLVSDADHALYAAKRLGRDRIMAG